VHTLLTRQICIVITIPTPRMQAINPDSPLPADDFRYGERRMISLSLALTPAAAVLSTSFVSGIFGMAGGMILLGILLAVMPLAAVHGLTQIAANGWRAWLWREHVLWPVVASYAAGAVTAAFILTAASLPASKPVTLMALGILSFAGLLIPSRLAPNIVRRSDGVGCGVLCSFLQLLAGVSGPIFDVFFVRSQLDRKQVVATKAAIQLLGHLLKVAYFARRVGAGDTTVAPPRHHACDAPCAAWYPAVPPCPGRSLNSGAGPAP